MALSFVIGAGCLLYGVYTLLGPAARDPEGKDLTASLLRTVDNLWFASLTRPDTRTAHTHSHTHTHTPTHTRTHAHAHTHSHTH